MPNYASDFPHPFFDWLEGKGYYSKENRDRRMYNGKGCTPNQRQEVIRQRGYSISLCCNNCDEIVMDEDCSIYNYCPRCGYHLIHMELC